MKNRGCLTTKNLKKNKLVFFDEKAMKGCKEVLKWRLINQPGLDTHRSGHLPQLFENVFVSQPQNTDVLITGN